MESFNQIDQLEKGALGPSLTREFFPPKTKQNMLPKTIGLNQVDTFDGGDVFQIIRRDYGWIIIG